MKKNDKIELENRLIELENKLIDIEKTTKYELAKSISFFIVMTVGCIQLLILALEAITEFFL